MTRGAEAAPWGQPTPGGDVVLESRQPYTESRQPYSESRQPYTEETLVIPKVIDERPEPPRTPVELAAAYGLTHAGSRPGMGAYLAQLWRYRNFILAYANGRLAAQFSTARLGRVWQVLTPLMNAAVYYFIFGIVLNTAGRVENFIAYLCTGIFIFTFTQSVVTSGVVSVSGQLGLVRALHFPRAALPIAMTMTHLQGLGVAIIVLAGIVVATGDPVSPSWLFLIPALALQTMFNFGLALFVARLGVKIPDVKQLMPYLMRTWMYASGVLYSVEMFSEHLPPLAASILHYNPMLVYIELARASLLENPPLASSWGELWLVGSGWAFVACVIGYVFFWRGEPGYGRG